MNGTRPWAENAGTIELAEVYSRPVISGGDRHGCEAAACLNLTNAPTFSEFVNELRSGHSSVLFMPHYRQPMELRLLEAVCDILRPYPEYPERKHWMDRFFYRDEGGAAQSLASLWRNREPWVLRPATGTLQFLGTAGDARGSADVLRSRRRGGILTRLRARLAASFQGLSADRAALALAAGLVLGTFPDLRMSHRSLRASEPDFRAESSRSSSGEPVGDAVVVGAAGAVRESGLAN